MHATATLTQLRRRQSDTERQRRTRSDAEGRALLDIETEGRAVVVRGRRKPIAIEAPIDWDAFDEAAVVVKARNLHAEVLECFREAKHGRT